MAAPPPAKVPAKAPAARAEPKPGDEPPLSAGPPSTPQMLFELDLAQFLAGITKNTGVRLEAADFAQVWPVSGLDLARPSLMGRGLGSSQQSVFVANVAPGTRYELEPDQALAARGMKLIKGGFCALREASPGPLLVCGPREQVLAYADAMLAQVGQLPNNVVSRVSIRLGRADDNPIYELRGDVPRYIDPLIARNGPLDKPPALRLALLDMGFELASRVVDSYEKLGRLSVSMAPEREGKLALSAAVPLEAGSLAQQAIAAARPVRLPAAFWALSEHSDSAIFFDTGLLAPFLAPSPRALALLAQAHSAGGGLVDELAGLQSACLAPGLAVAVAHGRLLDDKPKAPKPGPPTLQPVNPPAAPAAPSYMLLGVEDKKGACAKALSALLTSYERAAVVPGEAADKRRLKRLPIEKPLPASVTLLQLGSEQSPSYVSLASRPGALWLGSSSDLPALKWALADLLSQAPQRRGLRGRPELVELGKGTALVSGFVRDDALPFAGALEPRKPQGSPVSRLVADSAVRRVPFSLVAEGQSLRVSGQIEARSARLLLAKTIGEMWGSAELAKLPPQLQKGALNLLDASCHLGHGDACNLLGVVYGDGRGVAKDLARALAVLEVGCELGSGMACANLPFYKKSEKAEELKLFSKSCQLGSPYGCAWWGVRLLDGDNAAEKPLAFEKLSLGCDGYVGFACARIGVAYAQGNGLTQDETLGADFEERACELGLGVGCVGLGGAYASGKGRPHDEKRAFQYAVRACELDKAEGCYALGFAYLNGEGTPRDAAAARANFSIACEAEQAEACRQLAEMAGE